MRSKVNERMLEKAVEGQLGSVAKYGEHQDAAVLFCKLHNYINPHILICDHHIAFNFSTPVFLLKICMCHEVVL